MNQINIMLHDGTHLILAEDEMIQSIQSVLDDFQMPGMYLAIAKDYDKQIILNKEYIVAINVEEADND
ncbi:hypothetical protein DDG54_09300 [Staphylococcus pseudintermedius]|uniref:Uncharacterized protein n=1 Tax=Staphylococcus pseudintermedius TaxID=283734 RepID=A0A3D8YJH1_STAPS|nr:hypothetical protein [Staphylococcus pseudintermedius]EGQ0387905.1 hypothetical protein [Staphylococcus pseudintermedius]EGQ1305906.1 hypothetical protein [Staphylococcus pseudintermedius]EGQ1694850.1 hypothetical protein [Staphylococcus pseudintermedius]EGQ1736887.1 hypothetical protein [Staphylococcus pseudintermedius]EGQ1786202.1 hypothetical protein [Staphylococcus pseudintermedius]